MLAVTAPTAWLRVAQDVCARISSGETPIGAKISSTQQLAIRHSTSLGTVKRAVQHLTSAGVLEGRQGSGIFVKRAPTDADLGPAQTVDQRLAALEERASSAERRLSVLEQQDRVTSGIEAAPTDPHR